MKISFIVAIFLFGLSFCTTLVPESRNEDEIIVIDRKENRKYNLTAAFYGYYFKYGENDELTAKVIKYIIFRKNDTGEEVRYYPKEPEGEQHAHFYFTEIWSPDEEYLVLPIGRFDGFGIIKSADAMKAIKTNDFLDTIGVFNSYTSNSKREQLRLWHDFIGWKSASSISFDAGLSGHSDNYQYDFVNKKLTTSPEKVRTTIEGENKKGEIAIQSNATF